MYTYIFNEVSKRQTGWKGQDAKLRGLTSLARAARLPILVFNVKVGNFFITRFYGFKIRRGIFVVFIKRGIRPFNLASVMAVVLSIALLVVPLFGLSADGEPAAEQAVVVVDPSPAPVAVSEPVVVASQGSGQDTGDNSGSSGGGISRGHHRSEWRIRTRCFKQ